MVTLTEIKTLRRKHGLTQADLAQLSGVSQSLIAKIEAGRMDPTYSKAQQIFSSLETLSQAQEVKASSIMQKSVISVESSMTIKDAVKKMRKHSISQMPVLDGHVCVGTISEASILDALLQGKKEYIKDVLSDAPPVVSKNTRISILSHLLKTFDILLVSDEGKIKGVITKADLIKSL